MSSNSELSFDYDEYKGAAEYGIGYGGHGSDWEGIGQSNKILELDLNSNSQNDSHEEKYIEFMEEPLEK